MTMKLHAGTHTFLYAVSSSSLPSPVIVGKMMNPVGFSVGNWLCFGTLISQQYGSTRLSDVWWRPCLCRCQVNKLLKQTSQWSDHSVLCFTDCSVRVCIVELLAVCCIFNVNYQFRHWYLLCSEGACHWFTRVLDWALFMLKYLSVAL